jgi:bacterial/archaeal transporter family protein
MASDDESSGGAFSKERRPGHGLVSSLASSVRDPIYGSLAAIERGALAFSSRSECSHRSAISGRLGGFTDSIGSEGWLDIVNEETGLFDSEGVPEHHHHSPPMIVWIFPALLCALAYALYNIFIKKGSASIQPILGGVILQFVAALSGTLLLLLIILRGKSREIHYDKWGVIWSTLAGLWVGTAEIVSFTVSSMGVPATQSIPIIIGGSVLFGSILGFVLLGEGMIWHGWSGVVMLTVGIGLVATDPGEKVEEGGGGGDGMDAPPLHVWIGPALFCALAYALYNICIKKGSATINHVLGGVILQFVAAIFGSCLLGGIVIAGDSSLTHDAAGIFWACLAGVAVGSAELLSFQVSGMGVQATQSIPVLIGGSVMFGAVLGIFMLGESLELQGWSGVVLLMSGIGLVATDPGN